MTRRFFVSMSASALLCWPAAALWAHHSAAQYDFGKSVKIEGVVKEFKAENPHTAVVLTVKDAKGTHDIQFEAQSRNNIYRRGWRPDSVHVGDKMTVEIAPTRSGKAGGYVKTFILADGTEF